MKSILVTGGAGYIGSHTIIELLEANYNVVVIDNLCNSSIESLKRIDQLKNCNVPFYKVDMRNRKELEKVICRYHFDCCIHFAGLMFLLA